jgi:hypothetical protein
VNSIHLLGRICRLSSKHLTSKASWVGWRAQDEDEDDEDLPPRKKSARRFIPVETSSEEVGPLDAVVIWASDWVIADPDRLGYGMSRRIEMMMMLVVGSPAMTCP